MKKILLAVLIFLFTVPVFAENTILIVGDSLSAGHGIDVKVGWVALLEKYLEDKSYDYKIVNISVSGYTTSNGLEVLPQALKDHQPEITIIELGGNDALRGLKVPVIKKNLQDMIDLAKKANSKVLLIGLRIPPNYGAEYTKQFQELFTELAEKNNISVVPLFLKDIDIDEKLMQPDRIHPTAEAQVRMLNNVLPVLKGVIH